MDFVSSPKHVRGRKIHLIDGIRLKPQSGDTNDPVTDNFSVNIPQITFFTLQFVYILGSGLWRQTSVDPYNLM